MTSVMYGRCSIWGVVARNIGPPASACVAGVAFRVIPRSRVVMGTSDVAMTADVKRPLGIQSNMVYGRCSIWYLKE